MKSWIEKNLKLAVVAANVIYIVITALQYFFKIINPALYFYLTLYFADFFIATICVYGGFEYFAKRKRLRQSNYIN